MEPVLWNNEGRKAMHSLINAQTEAMDEQMVSDIKNSGLLFMQETEAERLEDRMNAEQIERMRHYQSNQERFTEELRELEEGRGTQEGETNYQYKLLQAEQNKMALRLMQASVLGRETAAEQIRMESLEKIVSCRREILEKCQPQSIPWCFHKRQLEKEQAEYVKAVGGLNLRILTAATLDQVKGEREEREKKEEESVPELMQEFFHADFPEQALEESYVIKNLYTCLHNLELIRRIRRKEFSGDDAARVAQRLEAVREYENVVESVLWEYGFTIDIDALQIQEIREGDEAFAKKRQEYLANGALRYLLDRKRDGQAVNDEAELHDVPQKTCVEEKLSALEAELGMQRDKKTQITRTLTRRTSKQESVRMGDTIRAETKDQQGKMEHLQVKMRLRMIYNRMKRNLAAGFEGGSKVFASLEELFREYVLTNRKTLEDRGEAEEKEAKALTALKSALVKVYKETGNISRKYAAILLGLLTEESSGYLEVPSDGIQVEVKDEEIELGYGQQYGWEKKRNYRECKNMPLFTHRPNIKDIRQGGLRDCYLLAGLLSVVEQNPEEIMNIMRDNDDGTVTVRFQLGDTVNTGGVETREYTSYYITVHKSVPVLTKNERDAYSRGALWVKMIEKAYAASGLHRVRKQGDGERKQAYEKLRAKIQAKNEKLNYDDICGGTTGWFLGLLLGKEYKEHRDEEYGADHAADRIGKLLPPVNVPRQDQYNPQEFGMESVDSFVYELLSENGGAQELACLKLQKPISTDADYQTLMERYEESRTKLQSYRRMCMIHLGIVDTLIRKSKKDILKLNNRKAVNKWYDSLIDTFTGYKQASDNTKIRAKKSTGKLGKAIQKMQDRYITDAFQESFLQVSVSDFAKTVNILRMRHLEYLGRKKRNEPEEGEKGAGQVQAGYYTAKDKELYEKISGFLQAGAYVAFGTREISKKTTGMCGESESRGMVGTHAYALINTRRKLIDGVEHLYFVVVNPWAHKGVVYNTGGAQISEDEVDQEKEEGVFLLDLKRFAEVVRHWDAVPA